MRKTMMALTLVVLAVGCQRGGEGASATAEPQTDEERAFYALGHSMGGQLQPLSLSERELALVREGLSDRVLKRPTRVEEPEKHMRQLSQIAQERAGAASAKTKQEGEAYAEKAAQEEGAERTESGLVFRKLEEGEGPSPTPDDRVKVHYRGTLIDGTEFDSSYKRNEPAEFPLRGVIPCWTEGLQKMKVGGKAQLVCPAKIAYGDRGRPGIPGGATLIFEVELLEIVTPAAK